jgi:hypothetical protein
MIGKPALGLRALVGANELSIQVELRNTWGEPVYLMTLLDDWYKQLGVDNSVPTSQLPFVFHAGAQQVFLVHGESARPNASFATPRRPFGYKLDGGRRFCNTLRIQRPLLEWHAYAEPSEDNTAPERVRSLCYRLEVMRASEAEFVRPLGRLKGIWQVTGPAIVLEAAVDLPASVTLLRRLDPAFQRLAPALSPPLSRVSVA